MTFAATWSGGKDSCLSAYSALRQGHPVSHLANFISREHGRVRFHGVEAQLIRTQAEAIGIPLLQKARGDIDLCGENGEYHTLVVDGPIFNQRIALLETRPVYRNGYWFLDVQRYSLAPRAGVTGRTA